MMYLCIVVIKHTTMIQATKFQNKAEAKRITHSDLKSVRNEMKFENHAVLENLPVGYITGDAFFSNVERKLIKRLEDNGTIQ